MAQHMTNQSQPIVKNGVNVTGIFDVIGAVKADNELAQFKFRAGNKWIDGGHNRSTIKAFYGCRAEDTTRAAPFVLDAENRRSCSVATPAPIRWNTFSTLSRRA